MELQRRSGGDANIGRRQYPLLVGAGLQSIEVSPRLVRGREARDRTLPFPGLLLDALQINLRGGRLPKPEANGISYLKIPLNRFNATGCAAIRAVQE